MARGSQLVSGEIETKTHAGDGVASLLIAKPKARHLTSPPF